MKQDKIFEKLSEPDIIKDRKLSRKRVHIKSSVFLLLGGMKLKIKIPKFIKFSLFFLLIFIILIGVNFMVSYKDKADNIQISAKVYRIDDLSRRVTINWKWNVKPSSGRYDDLIAIIPDDSSWRFKDYSYDYNYKNLDKLQSIERWDGVPLIFLYNKLNIKTNKTPDFFIFEVPTGKSEDISIYYKLNKDDINSLNDEFKIYFVHNYKTILLDKFWLKKIVAKEDSNI